MTAAEADVTSTFPKPIALKTTLLNKGSSEEKRQEILERRLHQTSQSTASSVDFLLRPYCRFFHQQIERRNTH